MGKKFIAALVIIYIIAVLWTTQSADAGVTAYINKTTWVYARPSTNAARVRVARGTKVEVLAVRRDDPASHGNAEAYCCANDHPNDHAHTRNSCSFLAQKGGKGGMVQRGK